jgi:hypothetical protein
MKGDSLSELSLSMFMFLERGLGAFGDFEMLMIIHELFFEGHKVCVSSLLWTKSLSIA